MFNTTPALSDRSRPCWTVYAAICAIYLWVCAPAAQADVLAQVMDEGIAALLQEQVDVRRVATGMVVGVIDDKGRRIISYGTGGISNPAAVDGESVFELGSITKTFTATLLADMVARGEVRLTDPIGMYLPSSVRTPTYNGRQITLGDLASHLSGLPSDPDNSNHTDMHNPFVDYSVAQMYDYLSHVTLTRDIGSEFEYSNFGVGLLGHLLALRANTDYEALLRSRILNPLGMLHTGITVDPATQKHLVAGHYTPETPAPRFQAPTVPGAGSLRSSANDLLNYLAANMGQLDGTLAAVIDSTHPMRHTTGKPETDIALGWLIYHKHGSDIIWHSGLTNGFNAYIGFDLKGKRGVVVLANMHGNVSLIGQHLLNPEYPLPQPAMQH
jgi:CubicO group peptidase (beta-lactamase class C family)